MTSRIRELAIATILLLSTIPGALAQDRSVALAVGTESRLFLDKAFDTVILGDPRVADVRTDDNQSVVIKPLKAGVTNLVFVDARGVVTANIVVSVCGVSLKACGVHQSAL
jgi:Flp pilus assembly secretin CpaC